jgi:hypothetical protein
MKAKTDTRKHMDKTQLQIGWMKGINMSKRKSSADPPARTGPEGSGLFSPGFDDGWGEQPEAIQDEFLRISSQLPNVKWENIDMDSLTLNASLKGPWGVNRETIFIKVKVDIPTSYPKTKAPRFYVEKSSFMPDETHRKLERELQELGNRYLQRKQNCLYTAFTYLLGETDLETSTAFFKNVRDLDDDIDGLADESSSEEDENDAPTGGSASMSQELSGSTELDPSATLAPAQRPAAPPPPRFCGARFSNNGRLVCFFPTKEEKARVLFAIPHPDAYRERPKGEPAFAGFGRLAHDSPPPKHRFHDEASATEDQSGESDETDSATSTDSEAATVHKINFWYQPGRHFRKTWSANESLRSSGGGTGPGTGTGTGTSRKRTGKPKNIISMYDMQNELPSKRQLAQEYAIFGDGADVCSHNAAVAEKYGHPDLAHVWRYAALLLRRDIPLEIHDLQHSGQPVLVIARDVVARTRDAEAKGPTHEASLAGRVRWGHHPLARDLINDLFDYYEKIADIQMLAMLACIFGDYSMEEEAAIAASHLPQPKTPLPMKAPSFSLEYFPTDPALWYLNNYKSQASSAITTPRTATTPAMYSDSQDSDEVLGMAESRSHSYSCGETPPNLAREHLREVGQTQSLSTSPNTRLFYRSNSTVAAAIAASLPRALAGMVQVSASPPERARKRLSPAETSSSNLTPSAVTWATSTVFGGAAPETPGTSRTSLSDDEYLKDDLFSMVPVAVSCVPENQGLFDDDGWMSTSLIDRQRGQIYSNYRYAYAEMLHMWDQPLSRLEIMKFDVLKEDKLLSSSLDGRSTSHSSHANTENTNVKLDEPTSPNNTPSFYPTGGATSPTSPFANRRALFQDLLASGRGVDITGFCRVHDGVPLEPAEYLRPAQKGHRVNGAVGVCHRCSSANSSTASTIRGGAAAGERDLYTAPDLVPQMEMACVYCWEPVVGLYTPCLACGCVSHESCLAEWHALGGAECPVGHDCNCAEEATTAHADSWPGLWAALVGGWYGQDNSAAEDRDKDRERVGSAGGGEGKRLLSSPVKATPQRSRRKSAPADSAAFSLGRNYNSSGSSRDRGGSGATTHDSNGTNHGSVGLRRAATPTANTISSRLGGGKGGTGRRARGGVMGHRADEDDDNDNDADNGDGDAGGRESGQARHQHHHPSPLGIPSVTVTGVPPGGLLSGVKPPPRGQEPISAAQLSLGKRLKESSAGRPGVARRNSGGLAMWKSSMTGS